MKRRWLLPILASLACGAALRAGAPSARARARRAAPRCALDDTQLFAALRERQGEVSDEGLATSSRWRSGTCRTSIGLVLEDWVRRLDMHAWPLAALGTAKGDVVLADLETGSVVARARRAHPDYVAETSADLELLSGFDGGGVTALALRGQIVVSGGRDARARVWAIERRAGGGAAVAPQGRGAQEPDADAEVSAWAGSRLRQVAALPCGGVVSAVRLTRAGAIWVAALNGSLRRWDPAPAAAADPPAPATPGADAYAPALTLELGAAPLCLAVDDARGLLACGCADGSVHLLDSASGAPIDRWEAHPRSRARAVALAHDSVWSGGADGSLRRRFLKPAALAPEGGKAALDAERAAEQLTPPHGAAVVALAGRADGLLISAALDGTLRVWDAAPQGGGPVVCLYGLLGYKVWLGSVATDGERLVSDGSDNVLIVHDFGPRAEGADDEDDEEDEEDEDEDEEDDDDDDDDDEFDDDDLDEDALNGFRRM